MTGKDWLNSVWPYAYIIGIIVGLSLNWMYERTKEDKAESKQRHPSNLPTNK